MVNLMKCIYIGGNWRTIGTSKLKKGVSKGWQFLMDDGTIKFCHSLNFL
jgi:hypothetical protein